MKASMKIVKNPTSNAPQGAIILALLGLGGALAQDDAKPKWPERAEVKIEELLEIKRVAMRLPGMRSPEGELGRRAEAVMAEIGKLVSDLDLINELEKIETKDIRAKIALWAVVRLKRPEDFARFAEHYVNFPHPDKAADYYYLYQKDVPRQEGIFPRVLSVWPVNESDRIEANRRIIEYCYFMPPTGWKFTRDTYRSNMGDALLNMANMERSLIVLIADADAYANAMQYVEDNSDSDNIERYRMNSQSVHFLSLLPAPESFSELSILYRASGPRAIIMDIFKDIWGRGYWTFSLDADLKAHHDKWMVLANDDWSEPHKVEFARWLKTVPLKDPPEINPDNPFGTFE